MKLTNRQLVNILQGIINEGGLTETDDPDDAGGYTKYGLSQNGNPDLDVKKLNLEQIILVFKERYWSPYYDKITDSKLVSMVYDFGLFQGKSTSIKTLQKAVNLCWNQNLLKVDGIIGEKTFKAVEGVSNKVSLKSAFIIEALEEIKRDKEKRNNEKYYLGWVNRLFGWWRK